MGVFIAAPATARSGEPTDAAPAAVSASEFAERFERDNPRLDAIDAEVDAGDADVTEASLWPNPELRYAREELWPDSGDEAENFVTLEWALDLSGRRGRRADAARQRVRAARARAGDAKLAALIDALGAYYDAAHARLRVDALTGGRAPLARMVDALRARVKAGDAAGYHLARLELELAGYDERIADARTDLRVARRALGGLLGEPSARYDASDDLALPAAPAAADALVGDALADRGDYRATAFDEASAEAARSAADRGWVPVFDLGVGLKTAEVGSESATGYVALLGIEIPLFSRGQADAERARARRRAARARRAELERAIPAEVRVAAERLTAAVERAETFRTEQLDRARALVGKAEAVYEEGEGSVADLVDAYRTAVDAELRHLALRRRARAAALSLSLALGRRPELSR